MPHLQFDFSNVFSLCLAYIFKHAALPCNRETKITINLECYFSFIYFLPDSCCCATTVTLMIQHKDFHCAFAIAATLVVWSAIQFGQRSGTSHALCLLSAFSNFLFHAVNATAFHFLLVDCFYIIP